MRIQSQAQGRWRSRSARSAARPHRASSKGVAYLNDLLGTTVGAKSGATYTAAALSAFGEPLRQSGDAGASRHPGASASRHFFTGKPQVDGLGYAFLMRSYRADLAKWQTADPLGYPDGWNPLAYCNNDVTGCVDLWGCVAYDPKGLTDDELGQLNGALRNWLLDANTVGYPAVCVEGMTLTLAFLTRYMHSSGDQTLDSSVVSGEQRIADATRWISGQVLSGNMSPAPYSIEGLQWTSKDLRYSIGGCLIYSRVSPRTGGGYVITCSINDPYDFHSNLSVTLKHLGFEGWIYGWKGGNVVYDTWMRQLAEKNYARVFNTKISWVIVVEE